MVDSCEQSNKLSDYINGEKFLGEPSECQFLILLHVLSRRVTLSISTFIYVKVTEYLMGAGYIIEFA